MRQLLGVGVLFLVLVATPVRAQEAAPQQAPPFPSHGGASAVHPGDSAPHGKKTSKGTTHAEEAAKHGEGHSEGAMPNEVWWKWANFALLASVLGYLVNKHGGAFFRSRTEAIQSGIAQAAAERASAEARAADIERRVSNLTGEIAALRQRSEEEMSRESERMRAETAETLAKIEANAQAEIAAAAKHASEELKSHAASLALQMAEGQIRERMNTGEEAQLSDSFIRSIRERAGRNRA